MKKLLLVLILGLSLNVNASHLSGGMVTVAQTSYDSTSVAVYLLTDPSGIPSPNTLNVQKWEMNSVGWYVQNGTITLTKSSTLAHQGMNVITYVSDYLDLDSNKYRFIYENCCWGNINNSTNSFSSSIIISADYWHIPFHSLPYAEAPIWVNMQKDTLNSMKSVWGVYNCFLSQLEPDSANIIQTDLFSGYANGVFVPQNYTQLNMYVSNDSISWTPTSLGNYATGFEITEYRNGQIIGVQRIQWTFKVVGSTISIEENITDYNTQYKVYDWNGRYLGTSLENQKGFLILRDNNGKVKKVFCN